jgi:hypothetical protein
MPLPSWELTSPNDNNEVKLEGHKVVIAVLPDGEYGLPSAVTLGIFFFKKKEKRGQSYNCFHLLQPSQYSLSVHPATTLFAIKSQESSNSDISSLDCIQLMTRIWVPYVVPFFGRVLFVFGRYVWVPRYLNRYHVRTYEGSNHPFLEVEESGESCILIDETRPDRES